MNVDHKVEVWDVEKLIPYEANAKLHPEEQTAKLATAIQKFGWTQPIVVWTNGEIIAGHGRRLAALKLNLKRVPVIVRRDLSKAEADALRLADNRVTSTTYDQELVQEELLRLSDELDLDTIQLTDLGFDLKEVEFTMADLGDMVGDDAFVNDVAEAVEEQKAQNNSDAQSIDETLAPVVDSLGFKRVSVAQSRIIRSAIVRIEETTGKTGVEAFVEFMAGIE